MSRNSWSIVRSFHEPQSWLDLRTTGAECALHTPTSVRSQAWSGRGRCPNWSSKPVRRGNPTLARFDSGARSVERYRLRYRHSDAMLRLHSKKGGSSGGTKLIALAGAMIGRGLITAAALATKPGSEYSTGKPGRNVRVETRCRALGATNR